MAPSPPLSLANRTLAMVDSVLLPVQPKKTGILSDFIFAASTMIFFFSSGDSIEVSPVEPMISTALVPCCSWKRRRVWNPAKSTEPFLLNGVISATNEPVIFCLGMRFQSPRSYSLPLVGRVGWGSGGDARTSPLANNFASPPPTPPPQRGGEKNFKLPVFR